MASFSERQGFGAARTIAQLNGMDDALRNSIWNLLLRFYDSGAWGYISRIAGDGFFKFAVDKIPTGNDTARAWFRNLFFALPWNRVYDLVEFLCLKSPNVRGVSAESMRRSLNLVLERECSGYRFIGDILAPISDELEVVSVEDSLEKAGRLRFIGAAEHIRSSAQLLSQKPVPDYRNSMKEAISAVESVAKQLAGKTSGGLADALATLETNMQLHGALKQGFIKLYGYTSDEGGIRHAIIDDIPDLGYDEAKYMLVSCSAFVNYLLAKHEKFA